MSVKTKTANKRSRAKRDLSYGLLITRLKCVMEHGPRLVQNWKPWDQARLARAMKKNHATISRWFNPDPEKGNEMTITSLLAVCRVLKIDPMILFDDEA